MGVTVYADETSLKQEQVGNDCLIEGVMISSSSEIADIIGTTYTTMIF